MMSKGKILALSGRVYLGLVLFFLYAPILVMAAMSFNNSEFYQLPFQFSTNCRFRIWSRTLAA